ncbi:MAG: hypothetical protein WAT58_00455 [Candidatus Dormiibacterota bacterium]
MTDQLPSPKRRLRAVYTIPDEPSQRSQRVIYQLEDTGHPALRLRPTVRAIDDDGVRRYLYRVDAFSRLTGKHLGEAEEVAAPDSPEEFAVAAHEFQSEPFRRTVDALSRALVDQHAEAELKG